MIILNCFVLFYVLSVIGFDCTLGQEDGKIQGGQQAKNGEFPYLGLIAGGNACGCAFITLKKIVTAAHCLMLTYSPATYVDLKTTYVFAGSVKLADQDNGQMTQIEKYKIHSKYKPRGDGKMLYDIASAYLVNAFTANDMVKPMSIPSTDPNEFMKIWNNFVYSQKSCKIMGWGAESVTFSGGQPVAGQPSSTLKTTLVTPLSTDECRTWQGAGEDLLNMGYHCFMGKQKGDMPLFGDSGSPIECDGKVYGIASAITFWKNKPETPTPFYYVMFGPYLQELGISSACSLSSYNGKVLTVLFIVLTTLNHT